MKKTIYYCDMCGKETTPEESIEGEIPFKMIVDNVEVIDYLPMELCRECLDKFTDNFFNLLSEKQREIAKKRIEEHKKGILEDLEGESW